MKKREQLGMDPGGASVRLNRDLLFKFVMSSGEKCFRCGGELTRETFSIEHKEPWLDSHDPVKLFFDLDNVAFSHKVCNYRAARRPNKKYSSVSEQRKAEWQRQKLVRVYSPRKRREQYLRTGH
jgi:hypothetical protein